MPALPYVIGQWVRGERFYGRGALVEEILSVHRGPLWVVGTRRLGKTSLLRQLELLAPQSGFLPLFWDLQGADEPAELHRSFQEAVDDAGDRLEALGIEAAGGAGMDLFDHCGRLRRAARLRGLRLMLLCDETEALLRIQEREPSLLDRLRRLMQSHDDAQCVIASTIRLWALTARSGDTSPFLHGFTPPRYLGRLTHAESLDLIAQSHLAPALRPAIEPALAEEIARRCDGHPYLLQLVSKRFLETGDLEEASEQVAFDPMVSHFFEVDFEMLSQPERDLLRILGRASSSSSDSLFRDLRERQSDMTGCLLRLENLGYVRRGADRRYELANHYFRRWLAQHDARRSPSHPRGAVISGGPIADRTTEQPVVFDGRYLLLEEIGAGATGVVWRARDTVLQETIALKILRQEFGAQSEALERFRREVLFARDVGHPNIVKVHHLGDCRGQLYIAMRLIEGTTLARRIADSGPMPARALLTVSKGLASALEAAHAQRIVHRDVKPQNILLDGDGRPHLVDFGLARLMGSPSVTLAGVFLGTPDYASPEQASLLPADERSDLYSAGVVMSEMATGRRLFEAPSLQELLEMHRRRPAPDPRQGRPDLPPPLGALILRCLEKDPDRRPANASELSAALAAIGS